MKELFSFADTTLTDSEADQKFEIYLQCYKNNWKLFDDVIPCLDLLKVMGFQLAIISNGDYQQQVEKVEKIGIYDYFSHILTSSELGFSKPDSRIFTEACSIVFRRAEDCFYVGDRLETDALGSKKAGLKGIWLNRRNDVTHDEVLVIHRLEQLQDVFSVYKSIT